MRSAEDYAIELRDLCSRLRLRGHRSGGEFSKACSETMQPSEPAQNRIRRACAVLALAKQEKFIYYEERDSERRRSGSARNAVSKSGGFRERGGIWLTEAHIGNYKRTD